MNRKVAGSSRSRFDPTRVPLKLPTVSRVRWPRCRFDPTKVRL